MSRIEQSDQLIRLRDVTRSYVVGDSSFRALAGVSLDLPKAAFVAVVGRSGSGKSTLVNMLAGLDRPTQGSVEVGGERLEQLDEDALSLWRGRHVGVVFQFFQLLPTLTVAENVALPMDFCGTRGPKAARQRALELLGSVGIAEQADKLPSALSGGQQQRVAIARALANEPELVVADEPTGNLDSTTAEQVLELLASLTMQGRTVVMVTHDDALRSRADLVVTLTDGRVAKIEKGQRYA
ncbi:MAG: ABC transporter ATP-binding protein [Myxococcales bacterium]